MEFGRELRHQHREHRSPVAPTALAGPKPRTGWWVRLSVVLAMLQEVFSLMLVLMLVLVLMPGWPRWSWMNSASSSNDAHGGRGPRSIKMRMYGR